MRLSDRLGIRWARHGASIHSASPISFATSNKSAISTIVPLPRPEEPASVGLRHRTAVPRFCRRDAEILPRRLNCRLDRLLALKLVRAAGPKLQKTVMAMRANLFVFMTNREIKATNNATERASRPGGLVEKSPTVFAGNTVPPLRRLEIRHRNRATTRPPHYRLHTPHAPWLRRQSNRDKFVLRSQLQQLQPFATSQRTKTPTAAFKWPTSAISSRCLGPEDALCRGPATLIGTIELSPNRHLA